MASWEQEGLWLVDRLTCGSPPAAICRAYRVTGRLDSAALRTSWRALLDRHPVLTTTLTDLCDRTGPATSVHSGPSWSVADHRAAAGGDPESYAERLYTEWLDTPLGGTGLPSVRLRLVQLADTESCVLLALHRTVADDRSLGILAEELSTAYAAASHGRRPAECLPAPARSHASYARWQRRQVDTPRWRELVDWWTSTLTPPPPALDLPVDRSRPAGPSPRAGTVRFDWGTRYARPLAALAAAEGTTPGVVLLAAFQTLLYRYADEERIAVGIPVAVRPARGFERSIGPYTNPVIACTDFTGRPSFHTVLLRVISAVHAGLAHRGLPFAHLVGALNPQRHPGRVPLCDAMVLLPEEPEPVPALGGAVVRRLPVRSAFALADLTLSVERTQPLLAGRLDYRASLFDESSARLLVDQLRSLLHGALSNVDAPVDALALESVARTRSAVRAFDRIGAGPVGPCAVPELVRRWAARRPDACAVTGPEGEGLTYRALTGAAATVSAALRVAGGVAGAAVAVRMACGPVQAVALLGALGAGAHLVCLGTEDTGERGRAVLASLRPACLLLDGPPEGDELARWFRDEIGGRVLDAAALDTGATVRWRRVPRPLDGRAYVAYTSGSTGRPKGIVQTDGSFAQFVTWFADAFGIGPGSRVAQWAGPGYDASLCELFAALCAGATACPVPAGVRMHPGALVDWLRAARITVFQTVPSFAREVLRALRRDGSTRRLPALRWLLLAGEPLPGELADGLRDALPGSRLANLYGPTESILATWHEITAPTTGTAALGRPIPGRQVLVVDAEDRPCPAGVTGEIVIRSPHLTPYYLGGEDAGRSPFRPWRGPDPTGTGPASCYRTGDFGRRRWDGLLEFRGRGDFQVKFYGTRLELTDVEAALAAHESVAECAVAAVPGADGLVGRLIAYVVPRTDPSGTPRGSPAVWRAVLQHRFGRARLPLSFRTLPRLPRTAGGKVDRRALPEAGPVATSGDREPRGGTERQLAAIWARLLGTADLGRYDSFFASGGHSLQVPLLAARIREWSGVDVPLPELFANPTLAGLSALVTEAMEASP